MQKHLRTDKIPTFANFQFDLKRLQCQQRKEFYLLPTKCHPTWS